MRAYAPYAFVVMAFKGLDALRAALATCACDKFERFLSLGSNMGTRIIDRNHDLTALSHA
jgi:hypothetical protein